MVRAGSVRTLVVAILLSIVAGCGDSDAPPMGTVSGTVLIGGAAPKEPLRIAFFNATTGQGSAGEIEEDGSYELETPLPVGEYLVYFTMSYKEVSDEPRSTESEIVKSVPREYQSDTESPLKATVEEGSNTIDFDVPA